MSRTRGTSKQMFCTTTAWACKLRRVAASCWRRAPCWSGTGAADASTSSPSMVASSSEGSSDATWPKGSASYWQLWMRRNGVVFRSERVSLRQVMTVDSMSGWCQTLEATASKQGQGPRWGDFFFIFSPNLKQISILIRLWKKFQN